MMCIWMMWNNNFLLHNLTTLPLSCSCNMLCHFHCTAFFCLSLVMGKMIFGELISNNPSYHSFKLCRLVDMTGKYVGDIYRFLQIFWIPIHRFLEIFGGNTERSVRKENAVGKGVCYPCSPIRPVLCLFCGLAIEWGVGLLNELINVKRNILMVYQEAPAVLDESQAQF